MFYFTTPLPVSLYIHIPWCIHKCPYCDFNSFEIQEKIPEELYLNALLSDLDQELARIGQCSLGSIFIGGGTPSVLSPSIIFLLLEAIKKRFSIQPNVEVTLEANPGTVDKERFSAFHQAGITRLSLGIQSFNQTALQQIRRIHGPKEAMTAIEMAQHVGFEAINLDLMFGLPNQTVESSLADLRLAVSFQPAHLSWYQLTIEPNTHFYHHPPPALPTDDLLWDIQTIGQVYLAEQGYQQYEVSAYARKNRYCQHNLNYWQFGDYLGIGAGAHGKLTDIAQAKIIRTHKQRHPHRYIETASTPAVIAGSHILTEKETCLEFMMNALRLREGFTPEQFTQRTGLGLEYVSEPLQHSCEQGWLIQEKNLIRPSEEGLCFLNEMLDLFVL